MSQTQKKGKNILRVESAYECRCVVSIGRETLDKNNFLKLKMFEMTYLMIDTKLIFTIR